MAFPEQGRASTMAPAVSPFPAEPGGLGDLLELVPYVPAVCRVAAEHEVVLLPGRVRLISDVDFLTTSRADVAHVLVEVTRPPRTSGP